MKHRHGGRRSVVFGAMGGLLTSLVVAAVPAQAAAPGGTGPKAAATAESGTLQQDFAEASAEFHVPESVLLAVGYHETLWDSHQGRPSATGNYNVMGLTQVDRSDLIAPGTADRSAELNLRGEGSAKAAHPDKRALADVGSVKTSDPSLHTLDAAAKLTGIPASRLRTDARASVRGGAALLASYERAATGSLPAGPAGWYAAVARYSQSPDADGARQFADGVYTTMTTGASRTTDDGQAVTLPAQPASASPLAAQRNTALTALGLRSAVAGSTATTPAPECPSGLDCAFVPAAYAPNSSTDKSDYGNYDTANRPADGDAIQYIVIHDTEASYSATLNEFQDPTAYASAHYVIRSSDGQVTQLVQDKDIAWHAGNKALNAHSIGVEHEGYALSGASWYTEAQYESSAALVRYLAAKYDIPLDRQHILGHDDIPGPLDAYVAGMHWDPGTYWDWSHYMSLLGAPLGGSGTPLVGGEVTIDPPFTSANEPTVTGCPSTCAAQPANFVYLRTSPSATAPLITDSIVKSSGGGTGTTDASDWTDKAVAGQTFIVAAVQTDWTAIWYDGQEAWFYNPGGQNAVANGNNAHTAVTPSGTAPVQVYGRNYPESAAYPDALQSVAQDPNQQVTPLSYTIPAGQVYTAATPVAGDFFYAENYDLSAPGDHTLVVGTTQYYPIRYNHRIAYVQASDVRTVTPVQPPSGTYVPQGPTRVLDTRNGTGGFSAPVGAKGTISLQVTGRAGVPASGVTAVVLNVTAVSPTATSYVSVYPDGRPRSSASNLNFVAGETFPNLVVVPVINGMVDFYNNAGSVQLVADLDGYYTSTGTGSVFDSAGPTRILDTRNGTGGFSAPVGAKGTISLQVTGSAGVPTSGVTAVVLNVTAVSPTATSYVSVYPDGRPRSSASNLNFAAGETFPNLVVVPVVNGKVDFYNNAGSVQLIADLDGYYSSTDPGAVYHTTGPTRIMDTRNGTGGVHTALGAKATVTLQVEGHSGVPSSGVTAVVLNVTAVSPTASSYVSVYPDGTTRSSASNLNFTAGETFPNLVVVPVVNGKVDFYNNAGSVQLIADLDGYYTS